MTPHRSEAASLTFSSSIMRCSISALAAISLETITSSSIPERILDMVRPSRTPPDDARLSIIAEWTLPTNMQLACMKPSGVLEPGDSPMADNRTIFQLEADGYPWIGCECCKARCG